MYNAHGILKIDKAFLQKYFSEERNERIIKEIYISNRFWNKIGLFLMNCIEIIFLSFGLALSIQKDDLISFLYQLVIQLILYFAMKQMGYYLKFQRKVCSFTIGALFLFILWKYFRMNIMTQDFKDFNNYLDEKKSLSTWGYVMNVDLANQTVSFNRFKSVSFEITCILNTLILFLYYNKMIKNEREGKPIGYIHHSMWLKQFMVPYYLFIALVAFDTFFAQNIIQFIVLCFLILITFLWATGSESKNNVIKQAVFWSRRLYTFQLAMLALTQIAPIIESIQGNQNLYNFMFVTGLILNPVPKYAAYFHVFIICYLLAFGQLYETSYENYQSYLALRQDYFKGSIQELKENLIDQDDENDENLNEFGKKAVKRTLVHTLDKQTQNVNKAMLEQQELIKKKEEEEQKEHEKDKSYNILNYQKFVEHYAPYVYMWVLRITLIILAYGYHSYKGFILISWVLASFIIPLIPFVNFTVIVLMPAFILEFLFLYLINIPALFTNTNLKSSYLYEIFGYSFQVAPLEIGIYFYVSIFLIMLIPSRYILRLSRDEFRIDIFKKCSDKKSNLIFQFLFYILKLIHLPALFLIFVLGLREYNIYYIGLMFFFVVFAASLKTYRKTNMLLIQYSAFFLFTQYLWSLVSKQFEAESFISKIFNMITFSNVTTSDAGINKYLDYQIPYDQWAVFFIFIFLTAINSMFKEDIPHKWRTDPDDPTQEKLYASTAAYYEDKCDSVLRRKFPLIAKYLNRVMQIISQFIIIIILILQCAIVALQPPSLFYWGFLIFSLTLQTVVIKSSEDNPKFYPKCVAQSRILGVYSMCVLIAQVSYFFVTNENFLAQYNIQEVLNIISGPLVNYFNQIGLKKFSADTNIAAAFGSQIAFYIMAAYLQDYFLEAEEKYKLQKELEEQQDDENNYMTSIVMRKPGVQKKKTGQSQQQQILSPQNKLNRTEDEIEEEDQIEKIKISFENVRYTIPYFIYKRQDLWRFIDGISINFHLLTATVTIYYCTNWQISLFMAFYLCCSVILCIRASKDLYREGQVGVQVSKNASKAISIEAAHQLNKGYMEKAQSTLLKIRTNQWNYQYWILVFSMIIMYPTPSLEKLANKQLINSQQQIYTSIFWLFWSGIFKSQADITEIQSHLPLYIMMILLIIEKQFQKWSRNRFGCTIERIQQYKFIDENMRLVEEGLNSEKIKARIEEVQKTYRVNRPFKENHDISVSIGEARVECEKIERLYREQTEETRRQQLKDNLTLALKRKYFYVFRSSLKIILEQTSLLLLLLSCSIKSNVISVLYLVLLLSFLLIKNKTKGMLIMSYTFGIMIIIQYLLNLTNLTSANSPYEFPYMFEPYPSAAEPKGQFIFPWIPKFGVFTENPTLTHFLGLDPEHSNINDIWYDFANLVLLTIYFFNTGNPIDTQNIKVSFSLSKGCEYDLNVYAQIMKKHKADQKQGLIDLSLKEQPEKEDRDFDMEKSRNIDKNIFEESFSSQAADDSKEYLLGPTYYLMDLKQGIFYYYFTKKMRYFAYIGWQLFTIIAVFTLAFLCKSYLSLGYMITCIPLILYVTDFFHLETLSQHGKQWKNPYLICGPLMIYSFIDISLQIIFGSFLHSSSYWKETLGIDNLWIVGEFTGMEYLLASNTELSVLEATRLKFSILKCINLFFIFLQSRIYQSEGFAKFIKNDLKKLTNLAKNYKRMALTYRYNNLKIQQILTLQENKRRMFEGVSELKMKLKLWNELVQSGLTSAKNAHLHKDQQNSSRNLFSMQNQDEESKQETIQPFGSSLLQDTNQDSKKEPLLQTIQTDISKRQKLFEKLKKTNNIAKIRELAIQNDDYFEKQHLLKKMVKKLPRWGRYYYNLKSKKINLICFMTNVEDLKNTKKNMEQGKRKITNELEEIMMRDINIYYARKQALKKMGKTNSTGLPGMEKIKSQKNISSGIIKEEKLDFDKMPYTSEFLKSSNILPALFGAYMEYYFSNCSVIAYMFMLLSQIINAGLISILYPFAVFGYALMEEERPGKKFWNFMIIYTLFILFMKFMFQLDTWIMIEGLQDSYSSLNDWVLFGLWRTETTRAMFFYILPELGVLLALMGQIYYEILIGLHEQREIELENIQQARERFLRSLNDKNYQQTQTLIQQRQITIDEEQQPQTNLQLDEYGYTEDERIKEFLTNIKAVHISKQHKLYREDNTFIRASHQVNRKEFQDDIVPFQPRRRYSMIEDYTQRKFISQKLKDQRRSKKKPTFVKKYFAHKSYFQRLFPLVKEQKPGKDLYGEITFWQFVICVYLIAYYTEMDAVGTQNLEASSQFSINMVAVLFLQVFVMIVERYISRTNTRVVVRKIGVGGEDSSKSFDDKLLQTMRVSSQVNFQTSVKVNKLESQETAIILTPTSKKIADDMKQDVPNLILEQTKMTTQQVFKYLIQWFLLIFYHGLVFWYFPLRSNYAIYGQPTCNESSTSFEKYGCLSFKRNVVLIIFYLIFCYYFMLSAMQIRHGYPDFKRGSSLFDHQDRLHWIYYLIFYNLPFLLETKTILDWTFTKTSLDMFQWLQIVQFQSEQFMAKISGYFTFGHPLGKRIHIIEKCVCGCFCLSLILFFLIGPFLMFSNLSFIASYNLVTDAKTNFNMRILNTNTSEIFLFPLFEADTPLYIQPMSELEFKYRDYDTIVETKFFDYTQVQIIKIKNASEGIWGLSSSYKEDFKQMLNQAANQDPYLDIEIDFYYTFTRPGPLEAPKANGNDSRILDVFNDTDLQLIQQFVKAVNMDCSTNKHQSTSIIIPDFVQEEVRLTQSANIMALPILDYRTDSVNKRGLNLTYDCHDFWSLATDEGDSLEFTTFSDLIAASFISASSITAFYLAVTFMAGGVLRGFIYKGERVFIVDSRNSQALLNLIDCIYLMRHLENLKKEEELFFVLMDILRSPEVMKVITGISLRDDEVGKN